MNTTRVATPNDLKLSDCGARRGSCEGGAKKAATDVRQRLARTRRLRTGIAATVTRVAVRSSAWLGVAASVETPANGRPRRWLGTGKLPPVAVACAQKRRATPGETKWVMDQLTKGRRLTERDDVPGTDSRCEERRPDKWMMASVKGKLREKLR